MKTDYFNHKYFNSYYYANILSNLLDQRWEFLGFISQFFEIEPIISLIKPWQKESTLHKFIFYIISNIQLLCKKCNRIKGDKKILTSDLYEKWY